MIEFNVDDMTCGHCVSTVTRAVKEVDAAGKCEIDLATKRVKIVSDRPVEDFRAAIEGAGFTPIPL